MNSDVEHAVVAEMFANPRRIAEVTASMLTGDDFADAGLKMLYDHLVEAFYGDDPVDALTVGTILAPKLSQVWHCEPGQATERVQRLADLSPPGRIGDHAAVVRQKANARRLLQLARRIEAEVHSGEAPEAVAGMLGAEAMRIATGATAKAEIVSFADAGRELVRHLQKVMAARAAGVKLGVYTEIPGIDEWTYGIQPTELCIGAGPPGIGKSAVWWKAAMNFAAEQAKRPEGQRVGTLMLSLEMGSIPSNTRVATMISGVPTRDMREGTLSQYQLRKIIERWRDQADMPLWFDFSPSLRASALRAVVAEAVRRHNVGLVVIDHFRMFGMDKPPQNSVDHDEQKAEFLKVQIAKELNVAVVCLAHTRKLEDPNGRPRLSDLRGSQQISAHADFVNFLFRQDEDVLAMLWEKNRHGKPGESELEVDFSSMSVS